MTVDLAAQDDVASEVEGQRQGTLQLHSLMVWMQRPDMLFEAMRDAFAEGPPYARARGMARVWQKRIEATL